MVIVVSHRRRQSRLRPSTEHDSRAPPLDRYLLPIDQGIGSGQGILNPANVGLCLEYLKEGDPHYPVVVDAGVGTASDVTLAMELGADGVLLNTGIAGAKNPVQMARAMAHAIEAGRLAWLAGRIPRKRYASASSPLEGTIGPAVS